MPGRFFERQNSIEPSRCRILRKNHGMPFVKAFRLGSLNTNTPKTLCIKFQTFSLLQETKFFDKCLRNINLGAIECLLENLVRIPTTSEGTRIVKEVSEKLYLKPFLPQLSIYSGWYLKIYSRRLSIGCGNQRQTMKRSVLLRFIAKFCESWGISCTLWRARSMSCTQNQWMRRWLLKLQII